MGKMGKYAADPSQLVIVTDVGTYLSGFLGLTNVVTVDKFGPSAVVLTGQLAAYRGVPIIVSASAPKTETRRQGIDHGGQQHARTVQHLQPQYVVCGFPARPAD